MGLIDFALFVHLIKSKTNLTFLYIAINTPFYEKIEHIIPNFKQLSPLQAISEIMTSSDHYINIQLTKYISSCFDQRNMTFQSNQCNLIAIS